MEAQQTRWPIVLVCLTAIIFAKDTTQAQDRQNTRTQLPNFVQLAEKWGPSSLIFRRRSAASLQATAIILLKAMTRWMNSGGGFSGISSQHRNSRSPDKL